MFKLIKKKLETLLKHALRKTFWDIFSSLFSQRYTSIMHFGDGTA